MPYNATSNTAGSQPAQQAAPSSGGVFGAIGNLLGSNNAGAVGSGVIAAGQAQGVAQSGLSMAQLLAELGMEVPGINEQGAYNTLNAQFGLEQAGIGQQQLGLQGQGLAAQSQLAGLQQGIETQQYGLSMQQYPEQLAEAALQNKNALQQMSSQGAISGTLQTQGHGQELATQAAQYGFQQQDINRAQQQAQLGQQSEVAGYNYSAGDIARAQQNLELTAKANGISTQQLLAQWQQGLQQQGVQGVNDIQGLYTQLLNAQAGGVGSLGGAAAEQGLLSPGQMASGAQAGGFNPLMLFAGQGVG